jgi:hypothetical protein
MPSLTVPRAPQFGGDFLSPQEESSAILISVLKISECLGRSRLILGPDAVPVEKVIGID